MIHGIMVDGGTHIITVAGTTHGGTHPGIGIVHGITDGITADFITHGITAMVMAVGTVVVITGDSTLDITLLWLQIALQEAQAPTEQVQLICPVEHRWLLQGEQALHHVAL